MGWENKNGLRRGHFQDLVAWGGIEPPTQGFSSFPILERNQELTPELVYKTIGHVPLKAFAGLGHLVIVERKNLSADGVRYHCV